MRVEFLRELNFDINLPAAEKQKRLAIFNAVAMANNVSAVLGDLTKNIRNINLNETALKLNKIADGLKAGHHLTDGAQNNARAIQDAVNKSSDGDLKKLFDVFNEKIKDSSWSIRTYIQSQPQSLPQHTTAAASSSSKVAPADVNEYAHLEDVTKIEQLYNHVLNVNLNEEVQKNMESIEQLLQEDNAETYIDDAIHDVVKASTHAPLRDMFANFYEMNKNTAKLADLRPQSVEQGLLGMYPNVGQNPPVYAQPQVLDQPPVSNNNAVPAAAAPTNKPVTYYSSQQTYANPVVLPRTPDPVGSTAADKSLLATLAASQSSERAPAPKHDQAPTETSSGSIKQPTATVNVLLASKTAPQPATVSGSVQKHDRSVDEMLKDLWDIPTTHNPKLNTDKNSDVVAADSDDESEEKPKSKKKPKPKPTPA
jgi:hypothetical protein